MSPELELILMVPATETASNKAVLVKDFMRAPHTILEYAFFFQWLSSELSQGNTEFVSLIYCLTSLDMARARLLAIWLFKIVDFIPLFMGIK